MTNHLLRVRKLEFYQNLLRLIDIFEIKDSLSFGTNNLSTLTNNTFFLGLILVKMLSIINLSKTVI
jgi:hypothetical protein